MSKRLLSLSLVLMSTFFYTTNFSQNVLPTSGNVGIGTTAPSSDLEVKGRTTVEEFIAYDTAIFEKPVTIKDSIKIESRMTVDQDVKIKGQTVLIDDVKAKSDLKVFGTTRMKGDGVVEGDFRIKSLSDSIVVDERFIMIKPNGKIVSMDKSGLADLITYEAYQAECKFAPGTPITSYWKSTPGLSYGVLSTGTSCPARVGIGTDAPIAQLDVRGNVGIGFPAASTGVDYPTGFRLAVNGKIIAEGVKVEYYQDWPDFVFSADYEMDSIEKVEGFILQHKHLPGVPSALEIANDGYELQDMDAILLEKIENLYLYLIELKKENDLLKAEVELLKQH